MRTIVAGSRHCQSEVEVLRAIADSGFQITQVVSGCCRGVDLLGEKFAADRGIPVARYPADWKRLGRAAGPVRNMLMAANADALVAVLYPKSRGTASMIALAKKRGLAVYVHAVSP